MLTDLQQLEDKSESCMARELQPVFSEHETKRCPVFWMPQPKIAVVSGLVARFATFL